jgi:UDP-N-acetylglucosamine 2-epimerase (non-hydrolysing)
LHILHVVGARPNFVKAAPVLRAIRNRGVRQTLVHTGQHYGQNMSEIFFVQLDLPKPDINLKVGSGSHTWQTAEVMRRLEPVVLERKPDLVLVYGDVNSTVAAALVCSKLLITVAHVEAGLRSFDTTMPEETNRVITDRLSDFLFTPSEDADANLHHEGVSVGKIHRVGNVMIDSLVRLLPAAQDHARDGLPDRYAVATLHRAANVDDNDNLKAIVDALVEASDRLEVIFPVHPRTRQRISQFGIDTRQLRLSEPLSYLEFLALESRAAVVITDSGGIQEETTYLGVPCLTMRDNTERPITITSGTNVLVGNDKRKLIFEIDNILLGKGKRGDIPLLWDGHAAERIADILCDS